jgi:hypothetical protein
MPVNKLPANLMPAMYSHRIHDIVVIGRSHGYCIAIHGSMQRDLDVIAVPWTAKPSPPHVFVTALCEAMECLQNGDGPERKPHGRLVYTLLMGGALWMDLSVLEPYAQQDKFAPPEAVQGQFKKRGLKRGRKT